MQDSCLTEDVLIFSLLELLCLTQGVSFSSPESLSLLQDKLGLRNSDVCTSSGCRKNFGDGVRSKVLWGFLMKPERWRDLLDNKA